MSRTDRLQLIGFALLLIAFVAANLVMGLAERAEGPWRMIGLAGPMAVGLFGMWSLHSRAAALGLLLAAAAVSVLLMLFHVHTTVMHAMLPAMGMALALWAVTWAIVREVMPRLEPARQHMAIVVGAMLLVGHLAVFWAIFFGYANPWFQLHRTPAITTAEGIDDAARRHTVLQDMGVLVAGVMLGDPEDSAILQYSCPSRTPGRRRVGLLRGAVRGPLWFNVALADGTELRLHRIERRAQAIDWQSDGDRTCGLRAGDPVVIWATPQRNGVNDSAPLSPVRLIAQGTPEDFAQGFAVEAEYGARLFGGLAFLVALTGLIPLIAGVLSWWRRRRA